MSVCKPEVIRFAMDDYTESDRFPATEILERRSCPGYEQES
jgi:hypothetical protein